jgi:hypothetical protein
VYPWGRHFPGVCLLAALRPKYPYEVLGSPALIVGGSMGDD